MKGRLRIIAVIVCVVALGGIVASSFVPHGADQQGADAAQSGALTNADCQRCHQAVYEEWRGSMHAVSWTSPDVQAAFQHFGHDRKCESCHAPVPIFQTGIDKPVEFRKLHREEGVGCLSCHLLPDGSIAARTTNTDAPCRPTATPQLLTSQQCGGCHTAIYEDWLQSSYVTDGKTCQSCHMSQNDSRAGGFSHLCLGGHDDEVVRSAATLECEQEDEELVVVVANVKAGHNFPGERHNRVLLVEVVERSSEGEIVLGQQHIIKDITPFRGESSAEEIRPGEAATARFPVVENAAVAEVRLLYKRFPWITDAKALVVHRREVTIE